VCVQAHDCESRYTEGMSFDLSSYTGKVPVPQPLSHIDEMSKSIWLHYHKSVTNQEIMIATNGRIYNKIESLNLPKFVSTFT